MVNSSNFELYSWASLVVKCFEAAQNGTSSLVQLPLGLCKIVSSGNSKPYLGRSSYPKIRSIEFTFVPQFDFNNSVYAFLPHSFPSIFPRHLGRLFTLLDSCDNLDDLCISLELAFQGLALSSKMATYGKKKKSILPSFSILRDSSSSSGSKRDKAKKRGELFVLPFEFSRYFPRGRQHNQTFVLRRYTPLSVPLSVPLSAPLSAPLSTAVP